MTTYTEQERERKEIDARKESKKNEWDVTKVIDWSLAQTNFRFDWKEKEEEDWIENVKNKEKVTLRLLTLKIPTVAQPGKRICCAQWTDNSARNTHTHINAHRPCTVLPVASMTRVATPCLRGLCTRLQVIVCVFVLPNVFCNASLLQFRNRFGNNL